MGRQLCSLLLLAAVIPARPVLAQDNDASLPLEVKHRGTLVAGKDKPCLQLQANGPVRKLELLVSREGMKKVFKVKSMSFGNTRTVCWSEKPGRYEYAVVLSAAGARGKGRVSRELTVNISYLPPIKMILHKDKIDLDHRKLVFQINHPAGHAELTIRGRGGKVLGSARADYDGEAPGTHLELGWAPVQGEILRMDLKAFGSDGFWVGAAITPWTIEIPHEKVEFQTDKWDIRPSEAPKLDAAIKQIHKALKERAADLVVKLYVAGFTDTVGGTAHNRTLSTNRARAIARYFARRGVKLDTFYRGFGEEVLAVPTRDNQDEPRNRRALYVLASQPPVIAKGISWGAWKPIR